MALAAVLAGTTAIADMVDVIGVMLIVAILGLFLWAWKSSRNNPFDGKALRGRFRVIKGGNRERTRLKPKTHTKKLPRRGSGS